MCRSGPLGLVARTVQLRDELTEADADDLLHGEVPAPIGQHSRIVDWNDSGMLQAGDHAGCGQKASGAGRGVSLCGKEQLHGDRSIQHVVVDLPDLSHAPSSEEKHKGVALFGRLPPLFNGCSKRSQGGGPRGDESHESSLGPAFRARRQVRRYIA